MKQHVSKEELVAYRDGEDDPRVREHLAGCEECQRTFDDQRFSLSLRRLPALSDEAHPSSEELTAFWDNALSREAAGRVQRHLRGCDRCLAVYRRMRGIGPALAYASPPPGLVREVQKRFSSRPSPVDLGTLWLRRAGGALQLVPKPDFGYPGIACLSDATLDGAQRPKRGKPVRFEAGSLRLELQVVTKEDKVRLRVRLEWADTGKPAHDVPLRIEAELGDGGKSQTDDKGRAELDFPHGPAQLQILASTPVVLGLLDPSS